MNRSFLRMAFSLLIAMVSTTQGNCSDGDFVGAVNLRNASIREKTMEKSSAPVPLHPNSPNEFVCTIGSPERIVPLTRPGEANVVAILVVFRNKSATLNPEGIDYDYGLVPSLANMTLVRTDQLWGSDANLAQTSSTRTYKLTAPFDRDYFIDFAVDNKRIEKYRVRNSLLAAPCWYSVNGSKVE